MQWVGVGILQLHGSYIPASSVEDIAALSLQHGLKSDLNQGCQKGAPKWRCLRARTVLAHLFFEKHRFRARFCRIRFKLPQCVSDQPLHFVDRTRYAVNLHPLCFAPAMAGFSVVEQYSDGKSMIVVPLLRKGQMLCVVQVDLLEEDLRMTHKEPTNRSVEMSVARYEMSVARPAGSMVPRGGAQTVDRRFSVHADDGEFGQCTEEDSHASCGSSRLSCSQGRPCVFLQGERRHSRHITCACCERVD